MIPPGEMGQIFIPEGELLFDPVDGVVESFAYLSIRGEASGTSIKL
jgi:hypothetical protein